MFRKEKASGFATALIIAAAAGLLVTVLAGAITAYLIHSEMMEIQTVGYAAMGCLLLGSIVSAWIGTMKNQNNRLLTCMSAGAAYFVGLGSTSVILFDGVKRGVVPSLAVILAGSILVLLLGRGNGSKRKYKVPKLPK